MTTDEQRIFVCERLFGIKPPEPHQIAEGYSFQDWVDDLPPLTLDWLHACENKLSNLDHQKFCLFLHKQVMGTLDNFDVNGTCNLECISRAVNASAEQRLSALVETIQAEGKK